MGSKRRIKKHILPIILKNRKEGQWYVEPFVGGANIIEDVDNPRLGIDTNKFAIAVLSSITDGWEPPSVVTEQYYNNVKNNKQNYPDMIVGYVGFQLSYGGKFFGGYRRDAIGKRDYSKEAYKNTKNQAKKLVGCYFINCSYDLLGAIPESIIYCDPPYANTTKYKDGFDHDKFWQWCRDKSNEGHSVFISEYDAPDDFECVWQMEITSSLTKDTGSKKGIEKLFVYKGVK